MKTIKKSSQGSSAENNDIPDYEKKRIANIALQKSMFTDQLKKTALALKQKASGGIKRHNDYYHPGQKIKTKPKKVTCAKRSSRQKGPPPARLINKVSKELETVKKKQDNIKIKAIGMVIFSIKICLWTPEDISK